MRRWLSFRPSLKIICLQVLLLGLFSRCAPILAPIARRLPTPETVPCKAKARTAEEAELFKERYVMKWPSVAETINSPAVYMTTAVASWGILLMPESTAAFLGLDAYRFVYRSALGIAAVVSTSAALVAIGFRLHRWNRRRRAAARWLQDLPEMIAGLFGRRAIPPRVLYFARHEHTPSASDGRAGQLSHCQRSGVPTCRRWKHAGMAGGPCQRSLVPCEG